MAGFKNGGYYLCEITDQAFVKANSGTVGLKLQIMPLYEIEYQNPETKTECPNYTRDFTMWLSEKSAPLHRSFLANLGFTGKMSELDSTKEGYISLIGKEICLQNSHETRAGNTYDKFDYPREPLEREEIEKEEIDKF